ncbi:MAG: Beta-galactosidase C-terminal domain [Dermatophilaceae bacterium]
MMSYAAGPLAGRPAVTRRDVGDGAAWYLSTLPDDDTLGGLLDDVLLQSGVTPPVPDLPLGVEVTRRVSGDDAWLFLLNHTEAEQTLTAAGHDLVTDTPVAGTITLAAGAVAVVHEGWRAGPPAGS